MTLKTKTHPTRIPTPTHHEQFPPPSPLKEVGRAENEQVRTPSRLNDKTIQLKNNIERRKQKKKQIVKTKINENIRCGEN